MTSTNAYETSNSDVQLLDLLDISVVHKKHMILILVEIGILQSISISIEVEK